jgi:hypothetical protein
VLKITDKDCENNSGWKENEGDGKTLKLRCNHQQQEVVKEIWCEGSFADKGKKMKI